MAFTKERRILNASKPKELKTQPIAAMGPGEIKLPNTSGDFQKAIKRNEPVNPYDLVNKSYVDDNYYDGSEFTAGSILFSNGTDIAQDNANLFWDDTNNRLGIGTSSPSHLLEVQGSTSNLFKIERTGASGSSSLRFENSDDRISEVGLGADEVFSIWVNNAATRAFNIPESGSVGIGTTSPGSTLHVDQSSTTAAMPVLTLDQADVSEEMIEFVTTIGEGNAIEAVGSKSLTTTHFIKVTLPGGLTRYIPCGTIA